LSRIGVLLYIVTQIGNLFGVGNCIAGHKATVQIWLAFEKDRCPALHCIPDIYVLSRSCPMLKFTENVVFVTECGSCRHFELQNAITNMFIKEFDLRFEVQFTLVLI
jgi:hypothetical protein